MNKTRLLPNRAGLAIGIFATIALLIGISPAANAQLLVTGTFSGVPTGFLYNFQVENHTGVDIAVVNALIPTSGTSYTSDLMAPAGFQISIDEGSGSLTLLSDSSLFTDNTTVGGFSFVSTQIIPDATFDALDVDGNPFSGNFATVAVPEVGTLPLLATSLFGVIGVGIVRRRSRALAS